MKRDVAFIILVIFIGGIIALSSGCAPPPVVRVRPPEPRVEVYGSPPSSDAVWIPGYWRHKKGEWIWISGHWETPPRPKAIWIPGHWEPRGRGWLWIPGHWEHR